MSRYLCTYAAAVVHTEESQKNVHGIYQCSLYMEHKIEILFLYCLADNFCNYEHFILIKII